MLIQIYQTKLDIYSSHHKLLLKAGANPDTPIVESQDIHVPILFASDHEILEMLLKYKANITKVIGGMTALHATYNSDVKAQCRP